MRGNSFGPTTTMATTAMTRSSDQPISNMGFVERLSHYLVMAGLVPAIHDFLIRENSWMAGTRLAMTKGWV